MNQVTIFAHPSMANLRAAALGAIKAAVCPRAPQSICLCKVCVAINEKRSPFLLYITPRTSYTREHVEPFHEAASLSQSAETPLFCVLENPEFLLAPAANSLLKTLEEPPVHMRFILLSQNTRNILPTITSRAQVTFLDTASAGGFEVEHELATLFLEACAGRPINHAQLELILAKRCPDSSESMQIFDRIIESTSATAPHQVLEQLYSLRARPPAPGSSKIFWRTAFLTLLASR